MPRRTTPASALADRKVMAAFYAAAAVIAAVLILVAINGVADRADAPLFDPDLPNPMGGSARTAPGEVTGDLALGSLLVSGSEIAMGDIALGVTYVPSWEVSNPTGSDLALTVGQPQVHEGCCPGPVYLDGELTQANQSFVVPAGTSVQLQFPLQMHAGMDGPHHLSIPLTGDGAEDALHVTGNFTASAAA